MSRPRGGERPVVALPFDSQEGGRGKGETPSSRASSEASSGAGGIYHLEQIGQQVPVLDWTSHRTTPSFHAFFANSLNTQNTTTAPISFAKQAASSRDIALDLPGKSFERSNADRRSLEYRKLTPTLASSL